MSTEILTFVYFPLDSGEDGGIFRLDRARKAAKRGT